MSEYNEMEFRAKLLANQKDKLIAEFLNDLEHYYDYDFEDPEKMEALLQKWEQRKEEVK